MYRYSHPGSCRRWGGRVQDPCHLDVRKKCATQGPLFQYPLMGIFRASHGCDANCGRYHPPSRVASPSSFLSDLSIVANAKQCKGRVGRSIRNSRRCRYAGVWAGDSRTDGRGCARVLRQPWSAITPIFSLHRAHCTLMVRCPNPTKSHACLAAGLLAISRQLSAQGHGLRRLQLRDFPTQSGCISFADTALCICFYFCTYRHHWAGLFQALTTRRVAKHLCLRVACPTAQPDRDRRHRSALAAVPSSSFAGTRDHESLSLECALDRR